MRNNKGIRKGLAVAVILLFIGVAFAPSINANVSKDELVELDVEFCGLGKKHTVKLTQQEAEEVEQLFDDIEQRLSEVETREEAEVIFKEAVVELDKYGLLGGLGVRQTQRFIVGEKQKSLISNILEKSYNMNQGIDDISPYNFFCFVASHVSDSGDIGLFTLIGLIVGLTGYLFSILTGLFGEIALYVWITIMSIPFVFNFLKPLHFMNLSILNVDSFFYAVGLLGVSDKNDIIGDIGLFGFTGLKITKFDYNSNTFSAFYLGFSLAVAPFPFPTFDLENQE